MQILFPVLVGLPVTEQLQASMHSLLNVPLLVYVNQTRGGTLTVRYCVISSEPMTSTTAEKKRYTIRFKDGSESKVIADTINEPDMSAAYSEIPFYEFQLGGDVVAKYRRDEVVGWYSSVLGSHV